MQFRNRRKRKEKVSTAQRHEAIRMRLSNYALPEAKRGPASGAAVVLKSAERKV